MKRVSLLSVFIILMLPVYVFSEPVSKCYTADKFLLKTSYDKSKKSKYGINHQLFVSYNKGEKITLNGEAVLDEKGNLKGIEYKDDSISFFIPAKNQNQILINDKDSKKIKESECFSFFASYDNTLNKEGSVVSIFTFGKDYKTSKLQQKFQPSFDCEKVEFPMDKAICNNNEISYMDRLFYSARACFKDKALSIADEKTVENIDKIAEDFIIFRNTSYKSNKDVFMSSEESDIKKAYTLGIMFLPMTIAANDGDLRVLGRDLFMSYYMLSMQGIKYSGRYEKGLGRSDIVKAVYGKYYDEIMFYYSGVYDNMNSRLSSLFYYTVYLLEQHNLIDEEGNFICK